MSPEIQAEQTPEKGRLEIFRNFVTGNRVMQAALAATLVLGAIGAESTPVGEHIPSAVSDILGVGKAETAEASVNWSCSFGLYTNDVYVYQYFASMDDLLVAYNSGNPSPLYWDFSSNAVRIQGTDRLIYGMESDVIYYDQNGVANYTILDTNGAVVESGSHTIDPSCNSTTTLPPTTSTAPPTTTAAPTTTQAPTTLRPTTTTTEAPITTSTSEAPATTEAPTTTTAEVSTTTTEKATTTTKASTTTKNSTTSIEATTSTTGSVGVLGESATAETTTTNSNQDSSNNNQEQGNSLPWFAFVGIGGAVIAVGIAEETVRRRRR